MPFIPPAQKLVSRAFHYVFPFLVTPCLCSPAKRPKPVSKPKSAQNGETIHSQEEQGTLSGTQTETSPTAQKGQVGVKSQFTINTGVEAMNELCTELVSSIFYLR